MVNFMVYVAANCVNKIIKLALDGILEEVCGILSGKKIADDIYITEIYPVENVKHSEKSFFMNISEQFSASKDMRSKGLILLGNYHSHPKNTAIPSETDMKFAYSNDAIYLIISLLNRRKPDIKVYKIINNTYIEEELLLI